MKTPAAQILKVVRRTGALSLAVWAVCAATTANAATPTVAVFSKTMNGYVRTLQPDNSYKPETYAFADGGRLNGNVGDKSMDSLKFRQVAGVVAASLKKQNYIATTDPKTADLLIFLSWGATTGLDAEGYETSMSTLSSDFRAMSNHADLGPTPGDVSGIDFQKEINDAAAAQMDSSLNRIALANQIRDENDRFNAGVLGYQVALNETNIMRPYSVTARDVLAEVEESRYFVVLQAYDFQALRQHKGKKLLWELRYSIPRHGVRFDEQLVDMTHYAAQFSGQDLGRLVRRPLRQGHVDVGTPVEVPPTPAK